MKERFFDLRVDWDDRKQPYHGPCEWLAEYPEEKKKYLRDIIEVLYPGRCADKPSVGLVHKLR